MVTSNRAVLTFYTNAGDVVRLSIPRACVDKSVQGARDAMEAIIDTNAVLTSAGIPRTIRGAEIIQTQRIVMV